MDKTISTIGMVANDHENENGDELDLDTKRENCERNNGL